MDEDFITRANIKRNEYLLKTEELFVANKNRWLADFAGCFRDTCVQIQKLQDELNLSVISHLDYTMLYNNFFNRRFISDIFVYGNRSYLDNSQRCIGSYDISFLFIFFDKLWDDLLVLKKRYVGKVTAKEITTFMLRTIPDFYSYFVNIARFAIAECIDKSPFVDIEKNEVFMVNVGGYMSKTETVYKERKNKDANKLAEWFSVQLWGKYIFGDYTDLDFSEKSFKYTDFRFAQFRRSTLNNTDFKGSSLIGANFRDTYMEGCRLDNCSIFEADFSNAILKNASFVNARAKVGLKDKNVWKFVGFLPACFRNADLTNVDFTGADITGADFTGAVLNGANFTGAILDNAIFDGCIGRAI